MLHPIWCLLALAAVSTVDAKVVTINNVQPRKDSAGNILNAHDGTLVRFGDTYYLYGTHYNPCTNFSDCERPCGWLSNTYALYSSPDLETWKLETTNVLPALTKTNNCTAYFEPNVVYNRFTKMYVMAYWAGVGFGWPKGAKSPCPPQGIPQIRIAVSPTPTGPFVPRDPYVTKYPMVSQVGIFVDDDGYGYLRYNTGGGMQVIEELKEDFLFTTGVFAPIKAGLFLEGGGMFKRNGMYTYIAGTGCCFCKAGGSARVFTAPHVFGPYTYQRDIDAADSHGVRAVPAQMFNVALLNTTSGKEVFMYFGERWQQTPDGKKSDVFQAWIPMSFDTNGVANNLTFVKQWTIDIP